MKIYNSKTEKIRLEQKENETQKKEIEKKRQEREQQSKVKTWGGGRGGFKRRELNTRGRKLKCRSSTNLKVHHVRQSTRHIL